MLFNHIKGLPIMYLILQNKPNFPKHQNNSNLSPDKGLRKSPASQPPKQTQFTERQNKRNLSPNKGLRKQTPLYEKRNTNYGFIRLMRRYFSSV